MPDDRFVTRAYQPGDETKILDLFARCFPHAPRTLEHFRWKYLDNPWGNAHISLTFDADGRLAGHYAGYVVPVFENQLAHQIGDTMTDPAFRHVGRGPTSILARTALHFYTTFCDNKIAYNYGFNVSNIHRFSIRFLRADRVEPVGYWHRPLPRKPIARLSRWIRGYQLELVRGFGEEFDEFFARVAPSYGFLVRRDAQYLRWRYGQCPDRGAFVVAIRKWRRVVGWSAFRIRGSSIVWGDGLFDAAHRDAVDVLLRHVVPSHAVEKIEAWFPPRPAWFADVLQREGFVSAAEPQDLSLMCVPFVMGDATARMRKSLYYTMGDSDLF